MRRIFVSVACALASCNAWQNIQCEQSANCDLSAGGECLAAPTGNTWCAYPDPSCSGGYRYSDQAVGDGLSGICVPAGSGSGSGSDFSCGSDGDCAGMSGTPFCAPSGACVACLDDSACTSALAPVCDGSAHACRGCEQDSECASGICLESNGTCAAADDTIYVANNGADTGECTQAAPCLTLSYALAKIATPRNVIRIVTASLNINSKVAMGVLANGYLDGNSTTIAGTGSGYMLEMNGGDMALSGVVVHPNASGSALHILSGRVTLVDATAEGATFVDGGELDASHAILESIDCYGSAAGIVNIKDSQLSEISTLNTKVTLERDLITDDMFGVGDAEIYAGSPSSPLTIENSVIVSADAYDDPLHLGGGVFRFNTVVNVSGQNLTATPIACGGGASYDVSNNIFAWNTSTPPQGCDMSYTLFDNFEALPPGTGNQIGSASTFFVDLANKNFHLAVGSPAIGAADPAACASIMIDHDGSSRPSAHCAVGAYEAP